MLIKNEQLKYNVVNRLLIQQQIALTAAEFHGLITGILCGGRQNEQWLLLLSHLTNDGLVFSDDLLSITQDLYLATQQALEQDNFIFQLLVPQDDNDLFDRIDALAGWVNHFLLGLGVKQLNLDKITGDVGEVIHDLRTIGQLGYEQDDNQDELAQSLEEVREYVRVAAMLCYSEFNSRTTGSDGDELLATIH